MCSLIQRPAPSVIDRFQEGSFTSQQCRTLMSSLTVSETAQRTIRIDRTATVTTTYIASHRIDDSKKTIPIGVVFVVSDCSCWSVEANIRSNNNHHHHASKNWNTLYPRVLCGSRAQDAQLLPPHDACWKVGSSTCCCCCCCMSVTTISDRRGTCPIVTERFCEGWVLSRILPRTMNSRFRFCSCKMLSTFVAIIYPQRHATLALYDCLFRLHVQHQLLRPRL